jgi:hypothetical protein
MRELCAIARYVGVKVVRLEKRQTLTGLVSSNLTLSAIPELRTMPRREQSSESAFK